MTQVQLIYTIEDFEPEVYATYTESTVDECRDPFMRELVRATLADGKSYESGAWSTKVVTE